jgi:processed acidic surface protein
MNQYEGGFTNEVFQSHRVLFHLLSVFLFLSYIPTASAAISETELNQYLSEMGMTKQELEEYLDYYEIPLEEFQSVEELSWILGTPINDENLQELLTRYDMTEQELHVLLNDFGDSIDHYMFIEELDAAVDFYSNHDEYMAEIEKELEQIGITEEETERFFQYLAQVEEEFQYQLDQMELIDSRLEKYLDVTDPSQLSDEDFEELAQILTETIERYEIIVKFKIDNEEIPLKDLLKMTEAPNNLTVDISSTDGEPLINFTIPSSFFETYEVIDEGEEMVDLGELSNEFTDHLHEEKYDDLNGIEK